jgi:threonylcarbamoyladenosine tRNA methylthiotransferase MtaB
MSEPKFVTFGCRLNTYETEVMRNHAEAAGKSKAENPDAEIIVTGCAAQTDPEMFAKMPEVSRVLGNEEKLKLASWQHGANARVSVSDIMEVKTAKPHLVDGLKERTRAFVQVQNGCDHRCTFCIIPFGRGNSRSLQAGDVVEQVRRLVGSGYSEVVLTGVDLTSWGADLEGAPKLGNLANRILKTVPELKRLRLSSIDSIEADPELMDVIAGEERVMPHIHLSLQSGDNMILKRMKRRHAREDSIAFCSELRTRRPGIVFGADVIAGFPTETDEMFANSLKIIDDCGLTYLHVFPFSARPGTPAERMPQLEKHLIKERAALLRAKGEQRLDQFLASEVGTTRQVLIETEAMGRTEHFAQVKFEARMAPGAIVTAQVTGRGQSHLEARLAA